MNQDSGVMLISEDKNLLHNVDDNSENKILACVSANNNYLSMNFFKTPKSS